MTLNSNIKRSRNLYGHLAMSFDGVGREKLLSSAKILTLRPNMPTTARNNIHLYPIGYANSNCLNPLNYLNLCVIRVGIT
jgi:hypothetical protein